MACPGAMYHNMARIFRVWRQILRRTRSDPVGFDALAVLLTFSECDPADLVGHLLPASPGDQVYFYSGRGPQ